MVVGYTPKAQQRGTNIIIFFTFPIYIDTSSHMSYNDFKTYEIITSHCSSTHPDRRSSADIIIKKCHGGQNGGQTPYRETLNISTFPRLDLPCDLKKESLNRVMSRGS